MEFFEKLKVKAKAAAAKVQYAGSKVVEFAAENPTVTVAVIALSGRVMWNVGRLHKQSQVRRLELDKKRSVYDPELGSRWQLKRPMTNSENWEFSQRLQLGQSRGEALNDMGLLKNN